MKTVERWKIDILFAILCLDKGNRYSSVDTRDESKMSEMLPDHQGVVPTTSSEKSNFYVSADRDMNIQPTQASRRRSGMSTAVDPPSCLHSPISYNVTLHHGLRSGHFKDQGRVDSFEVCFRRCCHDNDCNLVFMLRNYCYLVSCYDQESCALNPLVATVNKELAVAFVYKDRNNELLNWNRASMNHMSSLPAYFETDNAHKSEPSALNQHSIGMSDQIAESIPRYETAYGGTYKDIPQTFPVERTHFPIPQPAANDISPVTRNTVLYPENSLTCVPGVERYFITLKGGLNPGYFVEIEFVTNMEACKKYCCQKSDCDVALMQQEQCYLVTCPRLELCQDVPASSLRGITRISHMMRKGRSSEDERGVSRNQGEVIAGDRGNSRLIDYPESIDGIISNPGVHSKRNFYNYQSPNEDTSDARGNQGIIHDGIHANGDNLASDNEETYEGNGIGVNREFHKKGILEDQSTKKSSPMKMQRKDTIPIGYENNNLPSRSPLEPDDKRYDEEINILRDAIGDLEQKKHLQNEEESYGMRSSSEIPTPPSQSKTDFEKLFSKDRKDPLIFDDLAGKRHHNLQEGLGDMASDILSNILRHRATDSIESIWSNNKDPLQHEVTKAKETNTPEKIEKELQDHVVPKEQHKAMSGDLKEQSVTPWNNPKINKASDTMRLNTDLGKQGTSGEKNGSLDDQSKLIETLYNLVKETSKTKSEESIKHKGHYDKPGSVLNEETTNDGRNVDPEASESHGSNAEDEYSDYFDSDDGFMGGNSLNPNQLQTHFRHMHKSRPRLEANEDKAHYDGQDYHDNHNLDDQEYETDMGNNGGNVVVNENPSGNIEQNVEASENGEREQKLIDNAYQNLHDGKSNEKHGKTNNVLDEDLDFITDKLGEQEIQDRNIYGTDDKIGENSFSDYGDNNVDYTDDLLSNMDYYDSSGVKRKLLHVRPANVQRPHFQVHHKSTNPYWLKHAHSNSKENADIFEDKGQLLVSHAYNNRKPLAQRKPLVFIEKKQPSGQENDNLVMNELEKIEDELSDIKSLPKFQENSVKHNGLKPGSIGASKLGTSNIGTKVQSKNDEKTKESIVDILANLKDVTKEELNKDFKGEKSNKTEKLNVAKSDDEKLILDQLDGIKKSIGNISKPSTSPEKKISPKVDDIGDEISELLGEEWDIDKRSRIPKPNVADQLAHGRSRADFQGVIGKGDDTRGKILFYGTFVSTWVLFLNRSLQRLDFSTKRSCSRTFCC